jgi:hypothetical protein
MVSETSDYHFSVMLALSTGAEPYRCWRNAVMALLTCAHLFEKPSYVEGWIVLPRQTAIQITEHGWITSGPRLVDPSLVLVEPPAQAVFYFAGLELSLEELPQRLQGKILPLVCHDAYGADGLLHPGYQDAHRQAWQRARELAHKMHLSEDRIVVSGRAPTGAATLISW